MSHSKVRLWVHTVLVTKFREAQIFPSVEDEIHRILFTQFVATGCYVDRMNGIPDHIHILFLLNPKKAIAEVIGHVKGGSSHTINQSNLLPHKFAWQNGYAAFSVSESKTPLVRRYIDRQKIHHLGETYEEELKRLEQLHGLLPDSGSRDKSLGGEPINPWAEN